MAKYLIFRTDRIGDFITSQAITSSISEFSKQNQIDIVASRYNSKYINNFKYIKNISLKFAKYKLYINDIFLNFQRRSKIPEML